MANPLKKLSQKLHSPHSPNGDGKHHRVGSGDLTSPTSQSPHRRSLAQILHLDNSYTSSDNESETSDFDSDGPSKNQQRRMATKAKKKEAKSRLSLEHRDDSEERSRQRLEDAARVETEGEFL